VAIERATDREESGAGPVGLRDVSCVIHAHSDYSDGKATIPEILEAARSAGREAVLLTDHDSLGARHDGWEGWHDDVLLVVGNEVSADPGHLLVFGVEDEIDPDGLEEREITAAVAAGGGLAVAAHPFSAGWHVSRRLIRPYPWLELDDELLHGIELWSLLTDEAERWRSPRQVLRFMRDPRRHMVGPPEAHLRAWDQLCRTRRTVAIGGLDAHQRGVRVRGRLYSPLRYHRIFGLVGTHVLCENGFGCADASADTDALLAGLRAGRCYISVDWIGDPTGFSYEGVGAEGERVLMGEETTAAEVVIEAALPDPAELRLLRDGVEVAREAGTSLVHRARERGSYRVEAVREVGGQPRTWVLSNPIYMR
jgi:hypothetical protein